MGRTNSRTERPHCWNLLSGQNQVCPMVELACLTRFDTLHTVRDDDGSGHGNERGKRRCYRAFRIELVSTRQRCESIIKEGKIPNRANPTNRPTNQPTDRPRGPIVMARIRAERLKTSSFKLFLILISFMINSDCATELGLFVTVSRHPHQRAQASQKATTRSGSAGEWYI